MFLPSLDNVYVGKGLQESLPKIKEEIGEQLCKKYVIDKKV